MHSGTFCWHGHVSMQYKQYGSGVLCTELHTAKKELASVPIHAPTQQHGLEGGE